MLFTNRKGNVAKPLRMALGACIIQTEYGYPDEEIPLQIQENPYLQYFCGYSGYDEGAPVWCKLNSKMKVLVRQSIASSRYTALEPKP